MTLLFNRKNKKITLLLNGLTTKT